jgi:hypothetical protein
MFLRNAIVTALGAVTLTAVLNADFTSSEAEGLTVAAPCEPPLNIRLKAPQNLRIIGMALLESALGIDSSGPSADSDTWYSEFSNSAASPVIAHPYFDGLAGRGDCVAAYSLRNMDQILAYTDATHKKLDVTYDPENDPDPRRQDAAKVVVPPNIPSLPNNVRVPIPMVGEDTLFVTWDAWMGKEFSHTITGVGNYKHFQFASPRDRIWTEVKSDFNKSSPPALAMVEVRLYGQPEDGMIGPNVTNRHPASPMNAQFAIMPETWTRYWVYFKKVGEWHEFSLWLADASRGPVLINDRLQIKPHPASAGWASFWLEYNSSSFGKAEGYPARTSYVRNIVMLKGVTQPTTLMARP